jgi:hypothetical protein
MSESASHSSFLCPPSALLDSSSWNQSIECLLPVNACLIGPPSAIAQLVLRLTRSVIRRANANEGPLSGNVSADRNDGLWGVSGRLHDPARNGSYRGRSSRKQTVC